QHFFEHFCYPIPSVGGLAKIIPALVNMEARGYLDNSQAHVAMQGNHGETAIAQFQNSLRDTCATGHRIVEHGDTLSNQTGIKIKILKAVVVGMRPINNEDHGLGLANQFADLREGLFRSHLEMMNPAIQAVPADPGGDLDWVAP